MLTTEQYNNLSSHLDYVRNDVETIMKKEPVAVNGEVTGLIDDAKEHLAELQDIIVFLVVGNGSQISSQ